MSTLMQEHAHHLRTRGYSIVENVLDADQIESARTILAEILEREKEVGAQRGWQNKSWRVTYMLPQKHEMFRRLPLNPRLLPLMQMILGPNCLLSSLNGMTMSPAGESQKLHLDQHEHVPGMIVNINCTHALDDFTKANGATRVVPYSQDRPPGTPINHEDDEKNAVYLEAPAGSALLFNGGLVHAGSANTTSNWRRCLHFFYSRPWVRSQWDYPRSLSEDVIATLSDEQKRMFGFFGPEGRYDHRTHEVVRGHAVMA